MAAARYVRADHRQERPDDDAVGRRREDGRLTGEGGDRLRTGEGTASQSVRTTSPVTASTTATGPSERATVNACAASTARTPRLSTARTAAASMTVAATETKAALELDVTTGRDEQRDRRYGRMASTKHDGDGHGDREGSAARVDGGAKR
ncbi:hypothetical protein ON010_g16912 [Phytophthora cinnamomi]|nr:hypothetical protein ON010_g16912 [Phytophthora cinnamomi]